MSSRTKLTDKQIKKIKADYIEIGNYSEVARMNNISVTYVKRLVDNDTECLNKFKEKKQQNTEDILEYMNEIKDKQKRIIDLSLEALEERLSSDDKLNVKDIATVYGVIFDKAIKYKEMKSNNQTGKEVKRIQIINDLPKDE